MNRSTQHRSYVLILLASLVMRAGIPDGYMPASPGSGLLFELCPSSVPAGFMEALGGGHHHHHHDTTADSASHYDASQCPIGHMLSSAAAVDDLWQPEPVPAARVYTAAPALVSFSRSPGTHRSRGPPA